MVYDYDDNDNYVNVVQNLVDHFRQSYISGRIMEHH